MKSASSTSSLSFAAQGALASFLVLATGCGGSSGGGGGSDSCNASPVAQLGGIWSLQSGLQTDDLGLGPLPDLGLDGQAFQVQFAAAQSLEAPSDNCVAFYYVTSPSLDTTSLAGEASAFKAQSIEGEVAIDTLPDDAIELIALYYNSAADITVDFGLVCKFDPKSPDPCDFADSYVDLGGGAYSLVYDYWAYAGDQRVKRFADGAFEDGIADDAVLIAQGKVQVLHARPSLQVVDESDLTVIASAPISMVESGAAEPIAATVGRTRDASLLAFACADPLHPGQGLRLHLAPDEQARIAAVVCVRGARYALHAVQTGPLAIEGELVLLDAEKPRAWRIGGEQDGK